MNALASTLTEFVLKPTVIIVAMLATYYLLRRASAATRHFSLTLALVGLLALPFLSMGLPAWNLQVLPQAAAENVTTSNMGELQDKPLDGKFMGATPEGDLAAAPIAIGQGESSDGAAGMTAANLGGWLFPIWLLGTAFVLARVAAGLTRIRWIIQRAEPVADSDTLQMLDQCCEMLGLRSRPRLVVSERVGVPLVWGWRRPVMIFPRRFVAWTPARLRAVMLHELGHLRRSDWPVLLLGRVVASIYWFHPLVWHLERCAKRECERACDDLVVTAGTKPSDYASHLLSIARGSWDTPEGVQAALAVVRRSNLDSRLRSILNPLLRRGAPSRTAIALTSGVLMLALVPFASVQLAEKAYAGEPRTDVADDSRYEVRVKPAQNSDHGIHRKVDHVHEKIKQMMHGDEPDGEGGQLFKKAHALHQAARYDEAIEVFEEALAMDFRAATSSFNIACCYALKGDVSNAVSWMEKAREAGWDEPVAFVKDSDFDPIRSSSTFQRAVDDAFAAADTERLADKHYPYQHTIDLYAKLKDEGSTEGKYWYKVGTQLLAYRELDMAAGALNEAVDHMGQWNQNAMYNLACTYSIGGQTRQALKWLDNAVEAGFNQHERFVNDSDLDNLRGTSQFESISEKSEMLSLDRFPKRDWEKSDYSESRWAPAVELYRDYVKTSPDSGRGWFNLGYALHFSSRHDEAVDAWEKALELGHRTGTTTYNMACANAMLGRNGAAMDLLEQAVEMGSLGYHQLAHDEDLANLHEDARFQKLISTLEAEMEEHEKQKKKLKYKVKKAAKPASRDNES